MRNVRGGVADVADGWRQIDRAHLDVVSGFRNATRMTYRKRAPFEGPSLALVVTGGRHGYNSLRRDLATFRRHRLMGLMIAAPESLFWTRRGAGRRLARLLGVHPSTICRDVLTIQRAVLGRPPPKHRCWRPMPAFPWIPPQSAGKTQDRHGL